MLRVITSDKGEGKRFCPCLFVCLSVSRLLKNACMNLDEMWRVDRCRDMMNRLTFEPDPDYSPDAGTGLFSSISYKCCYSEFYYIRKIPRIRIGSPSLQRGLVLK